MSRHVRHVGYGRLELFSGDEYVREIGETAGWDFKDRDEFIARYNKYETLRAQLEAAEAEVAKHRRDKELYVLVTPQEVEQWLAAEGRAEAAEADAARYRWLRDEAARFKAHDPRGGLVVSVTRLQRRTDNTGFTGLAVTPVGDDFDAEIDAARTKEQQA